MPGSMTSDVSAEALEIQRLSTVTSPAMLAGTILTIGSESFSRPGALTGSGSGSEGRSDAIPTDRFLASESGDATLDTAQDRIDPSRLPPPVKGVSLATS